MSSHSHPTEIHFGDDPNKTVDLRAGNPVPHDPGEIQNIDAIIQKHNDASQDNTDHRSDSEPTEEVKIPHSRWDTNTRFELRDEVGRGGMGEVRSCCDIHLSREVVAKVLHQKFLNRPEVVSRFYEEIRITGQLEHPGVVPVYDSGVLPDGRPFFIMQRIWGFTLRAMLDERTSPLDGRSRLLKVFEQICHTLAYAHAQRIIHRDLTPSNVMVGLFGQVKVMDWGLAKSLDEPHRSYSQPATEPPPPPPVESPSPPEATPGLSIHTLDGSVMGTPAYMPPEQARGNIERLDERCDVYGLGAILCEILTGHPPHIDVHNKGMLRLAIKADLSGAHMRLENCGADHALIALTKDCLSPDPDQRPRDAGVVVDRLNNYFDMVLRQAEWDLERFFDLSSDFFCLAGFDGYFRRINENFSRVLGYTPADLLSQPFISFVHPDDHDRTMSVMGQLSEGLPVIRFRNRYRNSEGRYRWIEWSSKALVKDQLIFAVACDVTERVELEERVKHLEQLLAEKSPPPS